MTILLTIGLWAFAALIVLGMVINITQIGKPRKPIDGGTVAVATVLNLLFLATIGGALAYIGNN